MPTPEEYLEYFYPYLVDEADPRFIPGADIDTALAVAADYRPACLTVDRQNQAQAHYASYIIEFRRQQMTSGGSGASSSTSTSTTAGAITRRREGDVEVQYGTSGGSSSTVSAASRNANSGPTAPYASFMSLWLVCAPQDIAGPGQGSAGTGTGGAEAIIRRGAIITRRGWFVK